MRRRQVEVSTRSAAEPDAVFAVLIDGTTWPRWTAIERFQLEREGDPPPEGVGAIRVFHRGRTVGRDQTVEVVAGRRFGYVSLSGLPVRDYRATVELEPASGGTSIRWAASFEPRFPGSGGLLERGIGKFLAESAEGLARYAVSSR